MILPGTSTQNKVLETRYRKLIVVDFISGWFFVFQRLDWISVLDIFLVTVVFYIILIMVRDTQAVVLLRGVIFLVILLAVLTSLVNLPASSDQV